MRPVPDVYGGGILMAFSGLDGKTDFDRPLVASALPEKIGLRTHFDVPAQLFFEVYPEEIVASARNAAANDFWDLAVKTPKTQGRIRLAFLDAYAILVESPKNLYPSFYHGADACRFDAPRELVSQGASKGEPELAVVIRRQGNVLRTTLARAGADRSALANARRAQKADLDAVIKERRAFFRKLPILTDASERRQAAEAKAFAILKVNVESAQGKIPCRWTTPDRYPHRHMWLWDSGFHAMANRLFDPQLAIDSLRAVLALQRDDSFIALCGNPGGRCHEISTQPPVLAWSAWRAFETSQDLAFLRYAYPRLAAYVNWDLAHRRSPKSDLLEWFVEYDAQHCRCGESGIDNGPQWDYAGNAEAADFNGLICSEFEMLARMADALGHESDARDWRAKRAHFARLVNERLWDKRDGIYYNRGTDDGKLRRVKAAASLFPLIGWIPDKARARRMAQHLFNPRAFWTPAPIASCAADEPCYCDDMWRGPVWTVLNYVVACGLARCGLRREAVRLASATTRLIEKWYQRTGVFFEFFDSQDKRDPRRLARKGYRPFHVIEDYHWTAATYLLMRRKDFAV